MSWNFDRPVSKKDTIALIKNKVIGISAKQGPFPKDTTSRFKPIEMKWEIEQGADSALKIINKNGGSLVNIKTTNASREKDKQIQYQTWTSKGKKQTAITFKLIHFYDTLGEIVRSERWIIKTTKSDSKLKVPKLLYETSYIYKDGLPERIFIDDYDRGTARKFVIEYEYRKR
jgi:hypothetical protein